MQRSFRVTSAVFLSIILGLATAVEVAAQRNHERRGVVDISVKFESGECIYKISSPPDLVIKDYPDPADPPPPFKIRASGTLRFRALDGMSAQVVVKDDTIKQVRGYAHRGRATLYPDRTEIIRVRPPRDKDPGTHHMIDITCCTGGVSDNGTCREPVVAMRDLGRRDIQLAAGAISRHELSGLLAQPSEDDEPPPVAGPDMDVEP